MLSLLAAVFLAPVPLPRPEPTYALAVIAEDDFFEKRTFSLSDAFAIVGKGMPRDVCQAASKLANRYGGMTACLAE